MHRTSQQGEASSSSIPLPYGAPSVDVHQYSGPAPPPIEEPLRASLGAKHLNELVGNHAAYDDQCIALAKQAIDACGLTGAALETFSAQVHEFFDELRLRNCCYAFNLVHDALVCSMILSANARFGPLTVQEHLAPYHLSKEVCALIAKRADCKVEDVECIVHHPDFQWATCTSGPLVECYTRVIEPSARQVRSLAESEYYASMALLTPSTLRPR